MNDKLVARFGEQCEKYRGSIIRWYTGPLGGRESAEDLAQETFTRMWAGYGHKLGDLDWEGFEELVKTSARNACTDMMRARYAKKRDYRRETFLEDVSEPGDYVQDDRQETPLRLIETDERDQDIRSAIEGLPEEDAQLLHRRYMDGASFVELAEEFGKPAATLRPQEARARQKLYWTLHHLKGA